MGNEASGKLQMQPADTLPELVALPLVVNKAISQVPGHHKLHRSTCLLLIVYRVHLREPETTGESVLQPNNTGCCFSTGQNAQGQFTTGEYLGGYLRVTTYSRHSFTVSIKSSKSSLLYVL